MHHVQYIHARERIVKNMKKPGKNHGFHRVRSSDIVLRIDAKSASLVKSVCDEGDKCTMRSGRVFYSLRGPFGAAFGDLWGSSGVHLVLRSEP